jgi:drug/metabolite transporter (DMT)-like permease
MSTAVSTHKTVFILIVGLMAVASASILIKFCHAPALIITTYRLTIAAGLYCLYARMTTGPIYSAFTNKQLKWAFLSGLFLAFHFITWIASLKFTSVASSVILVQTSPVYVAVTSYVVLKEKFSKPKILGMLMTLVGVVLIGLVDLDSNGNSLKGNVLALCGAVGCAGYLLIGKYLRASIDTFRYVSVTYSVAAATALVFAVLHGDSFFNYNGRIFILFFLIAIIPQMIGHTSFNWALKYFSVTTISFTILGEPVIASVLAYFLLGEGLSACKISGGVLVFMGVIMILLTEKAGKS